MVQSGYKWEKVGESIMFMGEYQHNLDDKGRIVVPTKLRDGLGSSMIVTRGLDGCLAIYTLVQWDMIVSELAALPTTKKHIRQYIRLLTAKATEATLDKQGRILIPSSLAQEASLTKQCMFVGVSDHVELWDQERWENYYDTSSDSFEDIAEKISEFIA